LPYQPVYTLTLGGRGSAVPKQVFISYAKDDKTWAELICAQLEKAGITCWIAPRDIKPGVTWPTAITEAIGQCRAMVIVFSAHANQSPHMAREIECADSRRVPIMPIRVENVTPANDMEYFLGNRQWFDLYERTSDRRIKGLREAVSGMLAGVDARGPIVGPLPVANPAPIAPLDVQPPVTVPRRPTRLLPYLLGMGGLLAILAAVLIFRSVNREPATVAKPDLAVALPVGKPAAPEVIDQGVGKVPPSGSIEVQPPGPQAYTLKATGPGAAIVNPPAPSEPSRASDLYMAGKVKILAHQSGEALALFRQSASFGDPRAMLEIGKLYRAGEGVAQDPSEAVSWFRKAAAAGNPSGMVSLAAMYAQGSGVPKDDREALSWFRKAADAGDGLGMDGLGQMYANGRGVPKDDAEAVRWFRKAADSGISNGMFHLGEMYERGSGVPKDLNKAIELDQKAAALGSRDAKLHLAQMEKPRSPQQPARGAVQVKIAGNRTWADSGVDLQPGDTVYVVADGCLPCSSLIGRVGVNGSPVEIGMKRKFSAAGIGKLYLRIDDNSAQTNSRLWTAMVLVQPARSPLP